jgi:hypothetical protein
MNWVKADIIKDDAQWRIWTAAADDDDDEYGWVQDPGNMTPKEYWEAAPVTFPTRALAEDYAQGNVINLSNYVVKQGIEPPPLPESYHELQNHIVKLRQEMLRNEPRSDRGQSVTTGARNGIIQECIDAISMNRADDGMDSDEKAIHGLAISEAMRILEGLKGKR